MRIVLLLGGKKIPIQLTRREKEIERTAKKEQGFKLIVSYVTNFTQTLRVNDRYTY